MSKILDRLKEIFEGEFDEIESIGAGAFGEVFRCESSGSSGRVVAVKCFRHGSSDPAAKRFSREVRLLKSLEHPYVIRVYESQLTEEPLYFTMPLYSRSLEDEIDSMVGDDSRIVALFDRILDGVEYLHSQNVVHRDLKPCNILMNSDADIALSDLGLGRDLDALTTRQTVTGEGLGTYGYMAPEQVDQAADADARADIYSLGKILYELLSGERNPLAPLDFDLVPAKYRPIVRRCLARAREDRYQSAGELKRDWRLLTDPSSSRPVRSELLEIMKSIHEGIPDELPQLLVRATEEDPDALMEVVMDLEASTLSEIAEMDRQAIREVASTFARIIRGSAWGFAYTDKLADRLLDFFELEEDYELSADLLVTTADLGLRHHRWYVMRVTGRMLRSISEGAHVQQVRNRMKEIPDSALEVLAPYLGQIPAEFRSLFP